MEISGGRRSASPDKNTAGTYRRVNIKRSAAVYAERKAASAAMEIGWLPSEQLYADMEGLLRFFKTISAPDMRL